MSWKKTLLKNSRLYVIADKQLSCDRTRVCRGGLNLPYKSSLENIACRVSKAGVKIIQLRFKHCSKKAFLEQAWKLRKVLDKKTLFIINDFPDIVKQSCADGVHLGQGDASISSARKILGRNAIIGKSCATLKQAILAEKQGANYIGIGPVFKTPAKPAARTVNLVTLRKISKKINIPVFAIGGINKSNIKIILRCGIKRVAVIRAICNAANINKAVKELLFFL